MNQQAIEVINEALSHAGEDPIVMEQLAALENRRITPEKELPPLEFLFKLFGKPCFPRGELVGISGKPKSGKTFVSSILMALCFREEVLTMLRLSPDTLKVLWYDTEQSDESTQDILKNRILPMIGDDEDRGETFNVFNVRQESWRERLPLLEVAIGHFHPDLVIVDGIRDLINDINDGVLAQDTVERLMHLATREHCCIACILHQNKAAEDKNLRGWIGTELTHKAFEVYECEKDEDRIFSFTQKLTRKYDIVDTLKFIVDKRGIPQLLCVERLLEQEQRNRLHPSSGRADFNHSMIIEWDGNQPIFNLPALFAAAMPIEGRLYMARDMQEQVMKLSGITSPFFYNKQREAALKEGIIVKSLNEYAHICYYRPKTNQPRVEDELFPPAPGESPF